MNEALEAYQIARNFSAEQIEWYSNQAFYKHFLHRASGVLIILFAVLITYFSANLSAPTEKVLRFQKRNVIAVLAASSAIIASISSFYDWRSSWESHRLAQFELQALIRVAEIKQLELKMDKNADGMFKLAKELTLEVKMVLEKETAHYYSNQRGAKESFSNSTGNTD